MPSVTPSGHEIAYAKFGTLYLSNQYSIGSTHITIIQLTHNSKLFFA